MNQEKSHLKISGLIFWLLWTVTTAVAWSIFLTLNIIWGGLDQLRSLWLGGLIIGLLQWPVIRFRLRHGLIWVAATAFGTFFPGIFVLLRGNSNLTLLLSLFGTLLLQLVYLSFMVKRASLWLVVNLAALIVTTVICFLPVLGLLYSGSDNGALLLWGLLMLFGGAILGGITGLGLIWLLRHPISEDSSPHKPFRVFSFMNCIAAVVGILLIFFPLYSIWQSYFFHNNVACEMIKPGMTHTEVNKKLVNFHPIQEREMTFSKVINGTPQDETVPYPSQLDSHADKIVKFENVNFDDPWINTPNLGLGYDTSDKLVVISKDNNSNVFFSPADCPLTFQGWMSDLWR